MKTSTLFPLALGALTLSLSTLVLAKLPPLSDDAKAKAAEASAKTAHAGKVDNYKLCLSMDKTAAAYFAANKKAAKDVKPATPTAACEDPGAFVYPPPAAPAATAAAPAAPAAPAAGAKVAATAAAPKKP